MGIILINTNSSRGAHDFARSRGGKAASVVPVHVEEFSAAVPCEQVTTAKKSDVVHAGGHGEQLSRLSILLNKGAFVPVKGASL